MIDYFALLDQSRQPWLDPDELKDCYHHKTMLFHPDVQTDSGRDNSQISFSNLNEAYQVLRDPKRRLHHLLTLEGAAPSSNSETIPEQLLALFPEVGALTKRANLLLEKIEVSSNNLSRSLLKPELLDLQQETKKVRENIQRLFDSSMAELQQINADWVKSPTGQIKNLSRLHAVFAYLSRWTAQVDEITFKLSLH